jgi:hypothetical protein
MKSHVPSLIEKNVTLHPSASIQGAKGATLMIGSTYGGPARETPCDALAPGLIADATFGGHLAARSLEANQQGNEMDMFRREMPSLAHHEAKLSSGDGG